MPHPRKEAAAARQKEKKDSVRAEASRKAEEAQWKDDGDKVRIAKESRQAEKERKADEQLQKSLEKAELIRKEQEENASIGKNKKTTAVKKVNQADIRLSALMHFEQPVKKGASKAVAPAAPAVAIANDLPLEPNLNKMNQIETLMTGVHVESGSGLAEAVSAMHSAVGGIGKVDLHPEKRMKALHAAFEERRMKELMDEKPGLKRSQYKDMIFREWLKSPENPTRDLNK